jgi:hypothetical protein
MNQWNVLDTKNDLRKEGNSYPINPVSLLIFSPLNFGLSLNPGDEKK